jgi:hypothetical protein
MQAVASSI